MTEDFDLFGGDVAQATNNPQGPANNAAYEMDGPFFQEHQEWKDENSPEQKRAL